MIITTCKEYYFENNAGRFCIYKMYDIDGKHNNYFVNGNRKAAQFAFESIGRKAPNEHGNFHGREKAGYTACQELIDNAEWIKCVTTEMRLTD